VMVADGEEVIRNIWTRMTQLEGLHIYGEVAPQVNIDSLVTGIPVKEIKGRKMENLKVFFKSLEPLDMEMRREGISVETNKRRIRSSGRPSIRNMTNLRSLKLKLSGGMGGNDVYLTDVTGYFALYSLNNIQHLNVSQCQLSEPCAQILVKDKNLLTWKFKSPVFEDIIPKYGRHQITDKQSQDKFPLLKM